jgi:hypothetical protein
MFDPTRPAELRRWVFANAAPLVPDTDLLTAVVLVVNEAVTTAGATAAVAEDIGVTLRRGPAGLRCEVVATAVLPEIRRDRLPTDLRVRELWLAMRVSPDIDVHIRPHGTGSRISVTLLPGAWL